MNEKIYVLFLLKSPFLTGSTRNCRKQIGLEVCVCMKPRGCLCIPAGTPSSVHAGMSEQGSSRHTIAHSGG